MPAETTPWQLRPHLLPDYTVQADAAWHKNYWYRHPVTQQAVELLVSRRRNTPESRTILVVSNQVGVCGFHLRLYMRDRAIAHDTVELYSDLDSAEIVHRLEEFNCGQTSIMLTTAGMMRDFGVGISAGRIVIIEWNYLNLSVIERMLSKMILSGSISAPGIVNMFVHCHNNSSQVEILHRLWQTQDHRSLIRLEPDAIIAAMASFRTNVRPEADLAKELGRAWDKLVAMEEEAEALLEA